MSASVFLYLRKIGHFPSDGNKQLLNPNTFAFLLILVLFYPFNGKM